MRLPHAVFPVFKFRAQKTVFQVEAVFKSASIPVFKVLLKAVPLESPNSQLAVFKVHGTMNEFTVDVYSYLIRRMRFYNSFES